MSLAFVVVRQGIEGFDWLFFGMVSFLVQWIVLSSAGCMCTLRPWFRRCSDVLAGTTCYAIVLLLTAVFTVLGVWVTEGLEQLTMARLGSNILVAAVFSGVLLRYFYLQQQLKNREQAELRSRIQSLQSRIRPHFLFNCMNSIASLIQIDPDVAETMVVDLAQLFRASLKEASVVPIEEELMLCRRFVSIEKIRLGERLDIDWRVELKDEPAEIPSLLLQPLIENAIYHGVQPREEGGCVTVSLWVADQELHINVTNPVPVPKLPTGSSEVLGAQTASSIELQTQNNGIALDNIRHRLAAYYGDKGLISYALKGEHFHVDMSFPLKPRIPIKP